MTKPEKRPVLSKHDAGAKCCPSCFYIVYNAVRVCHGCGHEFYPSKAKPNDKA